MVPKHVAYLSWVQFPVAGLQCTVAVGVSLLILLDHGLMLTEHFHLRVSSSNAGELLHTGEHLLVLLLLILSNEFVESHGSR